MAYSEEARRLYAEGVVSYACGDYVGAIHNWDAVSRMPDAGELAARASSAAARARRIREMMTGSTPVPEPPEPVDETARKLYAEGVVAYSHGDYQGAIDKWNQTIQHPGGDSLADRSAAHIARADHVLDLMRSAAEAEREAWQALGDWLTNPNGSLRHIGGEGHGDSSYSGGVRCWCGRDHGPHNYLGLTTCWCGVYNEYVGTPH